jgi:uncharacterized Zn finger protein
MVVLRPAYCWDCDSCGRENFERGIIQEFSLEDLKGLVKCAHCGAVFGMIQTKDGD